MRPRLTALVRRLGGGGDQVPLQDRMVQTPLKLDNPYLLALLRSETMLRARVSFGESHRPPQVRTMPPREPLPNLHPSLEHRLFVGVENKVSSHDSEGRRFLFTLPICSPARFAELREKPFLERRMRA